MAKKGLTYEAQRRAKWPWVAGGVAIVAVAGWYLWPSSGADVSPAAGGFAMPVEGTVAREGRLAEKLTVVGQVIANKGVVVKPEMTGKVAKINFEDGAAVKAGAVLFVLDDGVQLAQLAQAQANLSLAENNAARYQRLLAENASSQQQVEAAAADAKLARANVQLARANLDKMHLRAPFAGVAGIRQVNLGEYVQPGQAMVNINENDKLRVVFRLPDAAANSVVVGSPVVIISPEGEFDAKVSAVDSALDPATRTREAQVTLDNSTGALLGGQFVRVRVQTQVAEKAVIIPDQALMPQGEKTFLYLANVAPEGGVMASKTEVTIGLRSDGQVEVTQGVRAGQTVVTAGQQKLQAPVMPVTVMSPTVITVREAPVETLGKSDSE